MSIVELRQYTLHPGRRDELVELFEREFVESQDELGARVVGTFREPARPDRFVWIREFDDMTARLAALTAFYTGPVWKANSAAANATMIDSDDVFLLESVAGAFGLGERAPVGAGEPGTSRVLAVVHLADAAPDPAEVEEALGVAPVVLRSAPYENDFTALPVRDERVVVRFAAYPTADDAAAARARLAPGALQVLELEPTARSAYRW
ncbi:NIPSNAP family protein [Pseudonocardia humida]|uniref:NIPSNAP family protein n=1 Tax=Pseudonocardia humida TaxID=2800819 RepID=UPI00207CF33A|nr:NIPSNAP family protein [Pseudonocardia humida]